MDSLPTVGERRQLLLFDDRSFFSSQFFSMFRNRTVQLRLSLTSNHPDSSETSNRTVRLRLLLLLGLGLPCGLFRLNLLCAETAIGRRLNLTQLEATIGRRLNFFTFFFHPDCVRLRLSFLPSTHPDSSETSNRTVRLRR